MISIVKITYPPFDYATSYFVYWADEEAILIDCVPNCYHKVKKLERELNKKVTSILLTHGHIDHIHDLQYFKKDGVNIVIHERDADKLYTDKHLGNRFNMFVPPVEADVLIDDYTESYNHEDYQIGVFLAPGHTAGSVCYVIEGILFSGDTLFRGCIGRTDLGDGTQVNMVQTLKRLKKEFPRDTLVYPGHGLETTLDNEYRLNTYLRDL